MKRQIQKKHQLVITIHSEPGDCTSYTYSFTIDPDRYSYRIWGTGDNSFPYPMEIPFWQFLKFEEIVCDSARSEIHAMADLFADAAKEFKCNAFTLLEVVRGIMEVGHV